MASEMLTCRVPEELVRRLDALVRAMDPPAGTTSMNRATATRLALEAGVTVLEKRLARAER